MKHLFRTVVGIFYAIFMAIIAPIRPTKNQDNTIPIVGMGSVSSDVIKNFWRVAERKLDYNVVSQDRFREVSGLIAHLLSPRNQQAARFNLNEVKDDLQAQRADGKKNLVTTLKFVDRFSVDDSDIADSLSYCDTSGDSVDYVLVPYQATNYFANGRKLKIDDATVRCIAEGKEEYRTDQINAYVMETLEKYRAYVSKKIFDPSQNYIGRFPNIDPTRPASDYDKGRDLPLFRDEANAQSYGQLNPFAKAQLTNQLMDAGIGENYVVVGNDFLTMYTQLIGKTTSNGFQGYDEAGNPVFSDNQFFRDDYVTLTGVDKPFLVMRDGAIQLVNWNRHVGSFVYESDDQIRTTIVDPIYNLTWDMLMEKNDCGEDVTWSMQLGIGTELIGYPDSSQYNELPKWKGTTDLYLYNITSADPSIDSFITNNPSNNSVITNRDENCDPAYDVVAAAASVSLNYAIDSSSNLIVSADATASQGASVPAAGFAWQIDGAAQAETSNTLTIASGGYAAGDVIAVQFTDGAGNTATDFIVYSEGTASLGVVAGSFDQNQGIAELNDGDTYDLGNIAQSATDGSNVISITVVNEGGNRTSIGVAAVATGAGSDGTLALPSSPALPYTLRGDNSNAYTFTVTLANATTGAKTQAIEITDNAGTPVTTTITITATVV